MSSNEWLILIGLAGVFTYLTRSVGFVLDTQRLPIFIKRLAYYFPIAIIASLALPPLIYPEKAWSVHWCNEALITGLITLGIAWFTRNLILVVFSSIFLLNLLTWLSRSI